MSKRLTTKEFVIKAKEIHGDKYDYSKVDYKNFATNVTIICHKHGPFKQQPGNHLQGNGCPKCANKANGLNRRKSLLDFMEKAKKIHGDKYDYSSVIYKNMHSKVKIICPVHGEFYQTPGNHCQGQGCPECGKITAAKKQTKSKKTFVNEIQNIHGDKYNYAGTIYVNNSTKIKIICPIHGEFYQLPTNHLNLGHGCPKCAEYGFSLDEPAILYYLYDPQEDLYKIGITNKTIEERFGKSFCSNRAIAILEQTHFDNGMDAYLAEQEILEAFGYARCENPSWPETKGGRTEFFKEDILHKHKDDNEKR